MKTRSKKPPSFATWLLKKITRPIDYNYAIGDFTESFKMLSNEKGNFLAKCWFWFEVIRSLPRFVKNLTYWSFIMFRNYLKISFRNL